MWKKGIRTTFNFDRWTLLYRNVHRIQPLQKWSDEICRADQDLWSCSRGLILTCIREGNTGEFLELKVFLTIKTFVSMNTFCPKISFTLGSKNTVSKSIKAFLRRWIYISKTSGENYCFAAVPVEECFENYEDFAVDRKILMTHGQNHTIEFIITVVLKNVSNSGVVNYFLTENHSGRSSISHPD